jgi:mannan endo-1,4-beta-mannosidase
MKSFCAAPGVTHALAVALMMQAASQAIAMDVISVFDNFVSVRDARLYEGQQELRFVSWNIPNLLTIEDGFEFLGESPWRWPDRFEIEDAFETVKQMGGRVARTYVLTVRRPGADMGDHVHVLAPGKFNEEAFVALDRVLQIANQKGIRVIIPFVDNWHWMGGVEQYAAFRGKEARSFWTDPQLIEDFKATLRFVVNRRNTLTGVRYRDDPAILGWETGNELDATPEWTAEIAAYLKQLDPNHLVIDGRSLHGVPTASLENPHIDVITTHHYPGENTDVVAQITAAATQTRGRKAYFVGEVGFIPIETARRVLDVVVDQEVSGVLYWSLRFHRREGGFYWHDEPSGASLFKAYHWPGFDSGDSYDERELLTALRNAAFRIRGLDPPSLAPPGPAQLLPIDHPARISWQGAAGASGYDVQRSTTAAGPWDQLAADVSDAAVQYRPLFADTTALPARDYYYRVIARGLGGAAEPSNVVGPVNAATHLLVDELSDMTQLVNVQGSAILRSDKPRQTQEDIHRLELAPGAAVVYQPSGDVAQIQVWVFADQANPPCEIAVSDDGSEFEVLPLQTQSPRREAGDYGYLQPVLLTARPTSAGSRYVRIANVAPASPEATPDRENAPRFQISRVEIVHQ